MFRLHTIPYQQQKDDFDIHENQLSILYVVIAITQVIQSISFLCNDGTSNEWLCH